MVDRRTVLGWLAGGAATVLAGAGQAKGKPTRPPGKPTPTPSPSPFVKAQGGTVALRPRSYSIYPAASADPPGTEERFPGDPGVGLVLTGGHPFTGTYTPPPGDDGIEDINNITGVNHVMSRRFYGNMWSRSDIIADQSAGRVPFPSFKLNATAANISLIVGGSQDTVLTNEAVWAAGQGYPIHTSFFHEPEDNFPTDPNATNFRAAVRRIVGIFRDNGATNVVWNNPVSQGRWAFDPTMGEASRGPWHKWDPDWKGTESGAGRPNASDWWTGVDSVVDLHGFDMYSPLVGGDDFRQFDTDLIYMRARMIADGREFKPWTVPEFGTASSVPYSGGNPGVAAWTSWHQRAFRCMRDYDGIGFMTYHAYFHNYVDGGPDPADRLAGYEAALASEASYLVTVRP